MRPEQVIAALRFDPLLPVWLIAAIAAAAALVCLLALWRRAKGAVIRCLAFAVLLLWLAGPRLVRETRENLPDIGLLVVDQTASMQVKDRSEITQAALAAIRDQARQFPDLERRLQPGAIISTERGAVTSSRKLKAVYRGGVALVGDASGSVDAITGEGLCLVFRQATALAEAIGCGDLAKYQQKHRQIARHPEWMAKLLVALGDHAYIRRMAMSVMTAHPILFAKMLAVHVGSFYEINHSDLSNVGHGATWTGDGPRTEPGPDPRRVHVE